MRTTTYRERSTRELGRITLMEGAIYAAYKSGSPVIGEAQLARAAHLKWDYTNREYSRRVVRDLMSDVVHLAAINHPGFTVRRPGDGTAFLTSDPSDSVRAAIPRVLCSLTKIRRALDELEPVITTGDPVLIGLYANVSAAQILLESRVATSAGPIAERINAGDL